MPQQPPNASAQSAHSQNSADADSSHDPDTDQLLSTVKTRDFRQWHHRQQVQQHIRDGTPYFTQPAPVPSPRRYRPSDLLQCHRKISYRQLNAPEETPAPRGRFWLGQRFEEDLIVPFLADATPDDIFVQNSIWIDFTESTPAGDLQIKGVTDPVLVDPDADPLLPTEIKTTTNIDHRDEPSPHHRAQLTAYLRGLSASSDRSITDGLLIYGDRDTFDTRTFSVPFDQAFWDRIREWLITHTRARRTNTLPPANPEHDWECEYCAYRHRCGQTDRPYNDVGPTGLLPLHAYPKAKVRDYLRAHADAGAKLTPTLAHHYPELTADYPVYDWTCDVCGATYEWDAIDWDGALSDPPNCPQCAQSGRYAPLRGPNPASQHATTPTTTES